MNTSKYLKEATVAAYWSGESKSIILEYKYKIIQDSFEYSQEWIVKPIHPKFKETAINPVKLQKQTSANVLSGKVHDSINIF